MVKSVPSSRSSRPTTPGSALNRLRQNDFAHHGHVGALGLVVRGKRPAGNRSDAEHVEDPRRHPLARHRLGVAVGAGHDHAADARNEPRRLLDRAAPGLPVGHVERRPVAARGRRGRFPDGHQTIGVAERERTKQRRVDEREDRAVGADAERERQRGHERKRRRPFQLADRELQVVAELVQPLGQAHIPISLSTEGGHRSFEARDVAKAVECQLTRGFRIDAARDELARPHLEVKGELFVDLALHRDAPQPRPQQAPHVDSRTLEMPVVNRRQVATSAASCSRPRSVRR